MLTIIRGLSPAGWVLLALPVVAVAGLIALPVDSLERVLVARGAGVLIALTMLLTIIGMPSDVRRIWIFFWLYLTSTVAGDVISSYQQVTMGEPEFPGLADLFYLSCYGFAFTGLLLLNRQLNPRRTLETLLDTAIVCLAFLIIVNYFVIAPQIALAPRVDAALLTSIAYPILDIFVLVSLVRIFVLATARNAAFTVFSIALCAFLFLDLAINYSYVTGITLDIQIPWLLALALTALASALPGARSIHGQDTDVLDRLNPGRTAIVAVSVLFAPALAILDLGWGDGRRSLATVSAGAVLVVLLLWRAYRLLRKVEVQRAALELSAREESEARREANAARLAAEAASVAKSYFLSVMSHEVRTPLNVVIGTVHTMDKTSLNEEAREDIEVIESASRSLLALINDILDLSKIEAGEFHLDPQPFSLRLLFHDLSVMFRHVSAEKGLRFSIDMPPRSADVTLVGDANRLRQILVNLIGNAFKFTSKGEVRVDVNVELVKSDERAVVSIAVHDTGVGIAPEEVHRLFEPFKQLDSSTSRKFGGTGLGLSIVRHLATMMGGDVKLEGKPGLGTTASLRLPFRLGSELHAEMTSTTGPQATRTIADTHILVVDDSDLNLRVIARQLAKLGARSRLCLSGDEAIRAIRAAPDGFDIVLMDIQMPEMDGFETTKAIRQLMNSRIPVVALTAGATESELRQSREVGMDEFLTKPISSQKLQSTIWQLVDKYRQSSGRRTSQKPPDPQASALSYPVIAGIDVQGTLESIGGDIGAFREFVRSFVSGSRGVAENIRAMISSGQNESAMAELHKLRGAAGQLGCQRLHDAAKTLEDALYASAADHSKEMSEFESAAEEVLSAAGRWLELPL